MTCVLIAAAGPVIRAITPDPVLAEAAVPMLRWQVSGSVFAAVVMLMTCLCQASGKALPALILSLSRQGVVYAAVLLAASALWPYDGILASQCISDVLSAALALLLARRFVFRNPAGSGGGRKNRAATSGL
jgi:Na+-driven multidrug efflux pump